jgi:ribosomal-protein-alanine N-acetyltransferase
MGREGFGGRWRAISPFAWKLRGSGQTEDAELLRTERLRLRPLTAADTVRIASLAGDWEVARMTARIPYPYSVQLAEQWIAGLAEGEVVRGIERRGKLIGVCGYMPHERGSAELGYWIGKRWWGQGFATEAARAVVDHCFASAGFERVTCGHFIDNPASGRVIAKLGFRFVGADRLWCEARQAEVETLRYELRRRAASD